MHERPLSPHLQIYRLPLTALLSISHRATGVVLSMGLIGWVGFLMAVAGGESHYTTAQAILSSWLGRLFLWAWIYALFFHLCHGVRHLFWDAVQGLDRDTLERHAQLELGVSVGLTVMTMIFAAANG